MNPNLHIFETTEETAHAVAEVILVKAKEKNKKSLPFNIALSGGSTPKLLFTLLVNEYADQMPWHILRLFWVDERCVPPTHAESNFGMTYNSLLKHVPIHDYNIFRMLGEDDSEKEAQRYEGLLDAQLVKKNGIPQFDLILLGMGDDGHTASIFPDNMGLLHAEQTVAVAVHPTSGQKRITLTGNVINHAEQVIFLVTGLAKSTVLRQIFKREPDFKNYPASYIHSQCGAASFYLDKAAANEL
ncbi:MAG TPA: 6-phosphogluconolactonase [Paludibacter sp.]